MIKIATEPLEDSLLFASPEKVITKLTRAEELTSEPCNALMDMDDAERIKKTEEASNAYSDAICLIPQIGQIGQRAWQRIIGICTSLDTMTCIAKECNEIGIDPEEFLLCHMGGIKIPEDNEKKYGVLDIRCLNIQARLVRETVIRALKAS